MGHAQTGWERPRTARGTHDPIENHRRTYFEVERAVDSVLFSPENLGQVVCHDEAAVKGRACGPYRSERGRRVPLDAYTMLEE